MGHALTWKVAIGCALMVVGSASAGTLVARDMAGNVVRLYDTPCEANEVLVHVKEVVRDKLKRADFLYRGTMYKSCWIKGPDGLIYVVDEGGDVTPIPPHVFKPDIGA